MRLFTRFSMVFLLFSSISISQIVYSPFVDSIKELCTEQTLIKITRQLSGDTACLIGGNPYTIVSRHYNNPSNNMAAQFILEQFQLYGLNAYYMNFSATGRNVYAVKTGTKFPNKKFIICSHYDNMPSGSLAPGADDNGSGTAAVLEAARLLAPLSLDYTVIFIAFDEEERGLYGSHAYADTASNRMDSIMFVFNYDMIAWDGNADRRLDLITNNNSLAFTDNIKLLYNLYEPQMAPYRVLNGNMSSSDHWYFWQRGYKAFCGIEYMSDFNPYYHTINDNMSHVIVPFYHGFTQAAIAALITYSNNYFMTFTHTPITSALTNQPQTAEVVITSPNPIANIGYSPRLYYKINTGAFTYVNAFYNSADTFRFQIPGQPAGTVVSYYIAAQDSLNRFVGTLPVGGKGINPPGTIPPPTFFTYDVITSVSQNNEPIRFTLDQNYPNPFNSSTYIRFFLDKPALTKLVIFDVLGKQVSVPVDFRLPQGENLVRFDANELASGIYFYSIFVDGLLKDTKKMIHNK